MNDFMHIFYHIDLQFLIWIQLIATNTTIRALKHLISIDRSAEQYQIKNQISHICFLLIGIYIVSKLSAMSEQQPSQKTERILRQLNKNGLSYLTSNLLNEAYDYLKQAEKAVAEQLKVSSSNPKINQFAGITYNNLACYYKKINKPKVALSYLKKALQIQVYKVEDWTSTASTHLNICAIYSYLQKHQQSADHAELALTMLQKVDAKTLKDVQVEEEKSYWNIKMLSHYNLAIQLQYLKKFADSKKHYLLAKETANVNQKKNQNIINSIDESVKRIEGNEQQQKKKLIDILAKRKVQQQKGHHQFMRHNKKNYGDEAQWRSLLDNKKYQIYKIENDPKKNYQSTEKVRRLAPLHDGNVSKRAMYPT